MRFRNCFDCGLESRTSSLVDAFNHLLVIFKVLSLKIGLASEN